MIDTKNAIPPLLLLERLYALYGGNKSRLARDLRVSRGTLDQWQFIPERYALTITDITDGALMTEEILLSAYAARHSPTTNEE